MKVPLDGFEIDEDGVDVVTSNLPKRRMQKWLYGFGFLLVCSSEPTAQHNKVWHWEPEYLV
jgi:hypothetical protein